LPNFQCQNMEKETIILMLNVTRCISAILEIYFYFISMKFGEKSFFPTSIFTFWFLVAWSINQVLLPHLEGRMDKLGFKSHRLPYWQQWLKTYSKYNVDSNL
jgi:hypothetical protein